MILLIDNYDSFAHNLARYLRRLGAEVQVERNDRIDVAAVRRLGPAAIVLSPGPCTPMEAGNSLSIVRELHSEIPMLGICLGHQTIAAALGAQICRASVPMHGRESEIEHNGTGLFTGLDNPISVARYHSLVIDPATLPDCFEVQARLADGTIMAIAHRELPIVGWQFHPESILTPVGPALLARFLESAGIGCGAGSFVISSECVAAKPADLASPDVPVTF